MFNGTQTARGYNVEPSDATQIMLGTPVNSQLVHGGNRRPEENIATLSDSTTAPPHYVAPAASATK